MTPEQRVEIEAKILKCKAEVKNDIRDAWVELKGLIQDVDTLKIDSQELKSNQAEIRLTLKHHEEQRVEFTTDIKTGLKELKEWFVRHNDEEMGKYNEIITLLKQTASDTNSNTTFINKLKKYWLSITLIGSGITGTLLVAYYIYTFLEDHGIMIVIEKAQ